MQKLNMQDLEVVSFATSPETDAAPAVTVDTQQAACDSPFCGPSFGRTCPETAIGG